MSPLLLVFLACGGAGSDQPAWALNTATIVPDATGAEGVQQWTFYDASWEKDQDPEAFHCGVLQEVTGTVVPSLDGCERCKVAYELRYSLIEGDCSNALNADPGLSAVTTIAIGDVPDELAPYAPHDDVLGWYIAFDGETAEPHGFAYPEDLDRGGDGDGDAWLNDVVYTLWPAYAWSL